MLHGTLTHSHISTWDYSSSYRHAFVCVYMPVRFYFSFISHCLFFFFFSRFFLFLLLVPLFLFAALFCSCSFSIFLIIGFQCCTRQLTVIQFSLTNSSSAGYFSSLMQSKMCVCVCVHGCIGYYSHSLWARMVSLYRICIQRFISVLNCVSVSVGCMLYAVACFLYFSLNIFSRLPFFLIPSYAHMQCCTHAHTLPGFLFHFYTKFCCYCWCSCFR